MFSEDILNTSSRANQDIVTPTLQASWREFDDWRQKYYSQLLARLCAPSCFEGPPFICPWDAVSLANTINGDVELQLLVSFHIYYNNAIDSNSRTLSQEEVIDIVPSYSFSAISPYESSPLTDRNVYCGEEPESLPFIPFSDDPDFNYLDFLHEHYPDGSFGWNIIKDPNSEMVFLHAAWLVYKQYQLSFEEIDNTHILPKLVLPGEDKRVDPGLLVISARRNYPPWPCFESPPFRDNDALGQLETQAEEVIGLFCNNLNCILGWCPTSHLEPTTLPSQSPATVPSHRYFSLYEPCGKGCFRFSDARDDERDARWNDNELLMFEQCLRVLPDAAPCNLARLYQKPCREVFSQRRRLIPDSNIQGHPKRSTKGRRKNSLNILDDSHARDLANWVPNEPCFHPGKSCEEAGDVCACVANFAYCQAACRCGIFPCRRRQKGCKCQKTDCQKAQCSCYKASRECDPTVCRSCGQSGVEQGTCANRSLQRGTWKSLEVKESQWGRGTFSREDIPMRTFISEYIGDILLLQTAVTRFELSIHRERNYFFHLEKNSHVLDSTFVGNETRYINHGAEDEANCEARKCLVNGEYRVGFWAKKDIAEGDELLFDYGEDFFMEERNDIQK